MPPALRWGRDPATLDVAVGQIVTTPESNKDRDESDSGARFEFTSTGLWPMNGEDSRSKASPT